MSEEVLVRCPSCGQMVIDGKFCNHCGVSLKGEAIPSMQMFQMGQMPFGGFMMINNMPVDDTVSSSFMRIDNTKPQNTTVSEEGLKKLVSFYTDQVLVKVEDSTVEHVLYERGENEYEIHSYLTGNREYTHFAYKASKELYDKIMEEIIKNDLSSLEGSEGDAITSGKAKLSFLMDGRMVEIENSNLPSDKAGAIMSVGALFNPYIVRSKMI